jgi:hypothetical protein
MVINRWSVVPALVARGWRFVKCPLAVSTRRGLKSSRDHENHIRGFEDESHPRRRGNVVWFVVTEGCGCDLLCGGAGNGIQLF